MRTGEQLKERGMQLALFNAGEDWSDAVIAFAALYAERTPHFKVEDIRAAWFAAGGDPPPKHNAWGSIGRNVVKHGIGKHEGRYMPAVSPSTHSHPVRLYRSLKWRRMLVAA